MVELKGLVLLVLLDFKYINTRGSKTTMAMKIYSTKEKTNSHHTVGWNINHEPFTAFRGRGSRHTAFLGVASVCKPSIDYGEFSRQDSILSVWAQNKKKYLPVEGGTFKIITTRKNSLLVVPCKKEEEEEIRLLHLHGGFRGSVFSPVVIKKGAEVLYKKSSSTHCQPSTHIIVRFKNGEGMVRVLFSGRRNNGAYYISSDDVKEIPSEECEAYETSMEIIEK